MDTRDGTDPIDFTAHSKSHDTATDESAPGTPRERRGRPSNPVYARVGDKVLSAAQDGVRRGLRPEDIIREIGATHHVRLNLGELRLLLASRRIPAE